jgi:hypothetical protein
MSIETGFEQAIRAIGAMRKSPTFDQSEIERLGDLTAEARAATLSYLANVMEAAEADEAARLQGRRLKRDRREES